MGRVQGVGFRWATKQVADDMGINGYVTNLIDGHVKIVAQAKAQNLSRFESAIKASPTPYGHVSGIKIQPINHVNFSSFTVK